MSFFSRFFGRQPSAKDITSERGPTELPTVRFDSKKVTSEIQADIMKTLQAVPEFSETDWLTIHPAAVQAVADGMNLHVLFQAIMARNIQGVTKGRAGEISRWVTSRAMALIKRNQQVELGITRAVWVHSGAPCQINPRHPSEDDIKQDAAHREVDGKEYDLAVGMILNGHWTLPGRDKGCKCSSKSVMPF